MAKSKKELSHAEQNGMGWLETIKEYVACLHADRERLEELRSERDAWTEEHDPLNGPDGVKLWAETSPDEAKELAALEAAVKIEGDEIDADACRERIEESPLSVQVRYGWITPGATAQMLKDGPEEFEILLSTGGPALRIIGKLGFHSQPESARLQHQDWGTPWTDCHFVSSDDEAIILRWASVFYFGD